MRLRAGKFEQGCQVKERGHHELIGVISVDSETNHFMLSLIRSEFTDYVVICVAHQLETILDYDQVAVFEGGSLVEFGDPGELMHKDSMFRSMVEA